MYVFWKVKEKSFRISFMLDCFIKEYVFWISSYLFFIINKSFQNLFSSLLEETAVSRKSYEKQSSRFQKKNATPPTGSPPCLHARTETQLATHCLYEVGGNIS